MHWGITIFFWIVIVALIIIGFVYAFKSSSDDSSKSLEVVDEEESCSYGEVKENKKCAIAPGGSCHSSNNQCVDGYICDASEGICVKDL